MSDYTIHGAWEGTSAVERALTVAAQSLDRDMSDEEQVLASQLLDIYTTFAPKRSGNLARGIKVRAGKHYFDIFVRIRDPESGYNYLTVTRFGHFKPFIYARGQSRVFRSRFGRGFRKALRLRLQGGGFIYRWRVRGFEPKYDWVQLARPSADKAFEKSADRLMRKVSGRVYSRFPTGGRQ